ncbi:MAG TPA: N-methyl-L-tryptophan oxidase [Xanthobacteraceae bacterium]|nr:N-methyl-L-tryptophan oxidase [Xanthobacteraceae bacterium]
METCDVAVIGLGIMGSAALYNLSQHPGVVLGFDPIQRGAKIGSSHGSCRVFRRFNFESEAYTALSDEAFKAWKGLEDASGEKILLPSRIVEAGRPGSALVAASRAAAAAAGRPSKPKTGADINGQFPAFRIPDDWDAAINDSGGILRADVALASYRAAVKDRVVAQRVRLERTRSQLNLVTGNKTYAAKQIIISAGAWITDFVPELKDYITVTRQAVGWFEPNKPAQVQYDDFPIFILDSPQGNIYGFPDFAGEGVKAAAHEHGCRLRHADDAAQDATVDDLAPVSTALSDYVPAAAGRLMRTEICLYTNTKGGDVDGSKAEEFIIDRLPDDPKIIVASPCSGHGFKFASAVGGILANMALNPNFSAPPEFSLRRFAPFR